MGLTLRLSPVSAKGSCWQVVDSPESPGLEIVPEPAEELD